MTHELPIPYRTRVAPADDPAARQAWEQLCAVSPHQSVFSRLAFVDAVGREMPLQPRMAITSEGGRPRAGALLYMKRRWPYTAAALPPLAALHSPLLDGPLAEADIHHSRTPLDALLQRIDAEAHQLTFALHPDLRDARPFSWRGWSVRTAYTYRLGIDDGMSVTSRWSSNPLRLLKKGEGQFDVHEDPVAIPQILDLVQASHERQEHEPALDGSVLGAMATALAAAGLARPFIARREGRPEAGAVVLSDGRTAYYWLAGSLPGAAMTVLLAEALALLQAEGVRHFDFAGANTPSIAEFKRRFGATLVPYFRVRRSRRLELRLADRLLGRF